MKRPEVKELSEQRRQGRKTPSALGLLAKDATGLRKEALFDGSLRGTRCDGSHPRKGHREYEARMLCLTASGNHCFTGKVTVRGVETALLIRQFRMNCAPAYRSNPKITVVCSMTNLGESPGSPTTTESRAMGACTGGTRRQSEPS